MDPTECSGHSHDHDHGDDLGLSLRPQVDLPAVQCLNEEVLNSGRAILKDHEARLSAEPYLKSNEDDPELLLYIPFTKAVILQSISVRSVEEAMGGNTREESAPPRRVKLFVNRDTMDFDTAREAEPEMKLELLPPKHFVEGTIDYPMTPARCFQGISSLTIFFEDNYSGDDQLSTLVSFVGLKGRGTKGKRPAVDTSNVKTGSRGTGRHMYPGQRAAPPPANPHPATLVVVGGLQNPPPQPTGLSGAPSRVGGAMPGLMPGSMARNADLQQAAQQSAYYYDPAAPPSSTMMIRGTTTTSVRENNRPGAYAVTRTNSGAARVHPIAVPPGVRPGSEFTVHAGQSRVRVRCPPDSRPGHTLQITLPPKPVTHHNLLKIAPLTSATGDIGGGQVAMTAKVQKVNQEASESGGTAQTFLVTIPEKVFPGMQFTVNINGQRFAVTCPSNAGPHMKVRIVPPTQPEDEPKAAPKTQVFEVTVPAGVRPNQPFVLMANGQRVFVTCPPNGVPGQKIRLQLPLQDVIGNIQLSYESETGGWCRTIRVTDLKFQWVRFNGKNEEQMTDAMETFDFSKAAYVRKLELLEGNDARMRTGKVTLVPANEAVVDSRLVYESKTLLSYADIANIQGKNLEEKTTWFQNICTQLTTPWENGHVKLVVRRHSLLNDSVDAVMSLSREDMRSRWRIEFLGEPAIDASDVTREWFQLVTEQIFDPDSGLWLSSFNNQLCMTINPASNISCPEDHLVYFRFLGRIMGRALFDGQLIKGHMVRHLYKHLLGWPITFEDLEGQDYQSLKEFTTMQDPLSMMGLDFTITEEIMGNRRDVELIPGGNMKEVTADNLPQYLEANLRYRMLDRTKLQITELLLGFFDIIPEPALTVFDPNELELILCGLPTMHRCGHNRRAGFDGL